jgi:hypothetical protein
MNLILNTQCSANSSIFLNTRHIILGKENEDSRGYMTYFRPKSVSPKMSNGIF